MTTKTKFMKIHGTDNDYIYIDTTRYPIAVPEKKTIEWSRFHTGIGSDGLILIGSSGKTDFSICIFNADGSEAMMRSSGSRCVGECVYEYGLTTKKEVTLDTRSGIKVLRLYVEGGKVTVVTVDVGSPLETETVDFGDQFPLQSTRVSMGSPHLVIFIEDITQTNLPEIGPQLGNCHLFPDKTDAKFAQIVGKGTIRVRVRERGSGITQAYEVGTCATTVAAVLHRLAGRKCDVMMDGGTITIEWEEATGHILITEPATKVFGGEMEGWVISIR